MATNRSMIQALERIEALIRNINNQTRELNAWREILNKHIVAQRKQHGHDWDDHYEYNERMGKCERVYR